MSDICLACNHSIQVHDNNFTEFYKDYEHACTKRLNGCHVTISTNSYLNDYPTECSCKKVHR